MHKSRFGDAHAENASLVKWHCRIRKKCMEIMELFKQKDADTNENQFEKKQTRSVKTDNGNCSLFTHQRLNVELPQSELCLALELTFI